MTYFNHVLTSVVFPMYDTMSKLIDGHAIVQQLILVFGQVFQYSERDQEDKY